MRLHGVCNACKFCAGLIGSHSVGNTSETIRQDGGAIADRIRLVLSALDHIFER